MALMSTLSSLSKKGLRDCFERLQQVSELLNVEEVRFISLLSPISFPSPFRLIFLSFPLSFASPFHSFASSTSHFTQLQFAKELRDSWDAIGTRQLTNSEMAQILLKRVDFQSKSLHVTRMFK